MLSRVQYRQNKCHQGSADDDVGGEVGEISSP